MLARETHTWHAHILVRTVVQLEPTAGEMSQARKTLIGLLARETDESTAEKLAYGLARLDPPAVERGLAGEALLGVLDRQTTSLHAEGLVRAIVQLNPTAEHQRQARETLLGMLDRDTDSENAYSWSADELAAGLVQLDPTVRDLNIWRATAVPSEELLTAVRLNSTLADWLAALPSLTQS